MVDSIVELHEQVPEEILVEDRSEAYDVTDGSRILGFVPLECLDNIGGENLESFLLVLIILDNMQPFTSIWLKDIDEGARVLQDPQTTGQLRCAGEAFIWLR
jgi:hypothetical protein